MTPERKIILPQERFFIAELVLRIAFGGEMDDEVAISRAKDYMELAQDGLFGHTADSLLLAGRGYKVKKLNPGETLADEYENI